MKNIVSISLGTSARNKEARTEFLDETFEIKRIGADGDTARYRKMVEELDGKVDCFGVGGMDVYVYAGAKRYAFQEPLQMMSGAKRTPWVDGSGLKHTLERETVAWLQESGALDFSDKHVLLVSAVDRFGMAEALSMRAHSVVYGDLLYGLGLPLPIRSWTVVQRLARVVLPFITRLPFQWFYPTGDKQKVNTPRFTRYFDEADIIAGDWHFIRRFAPNRLDNKIILTNTIRLADVEFLKERGAKLLITTTPVIAGESFATNVMEAVLVAYLKKNPEELTPADYLGTLKKLGWKPGLTQL